VSRSRRKDSLSDKQTRLPRLSRPNSLIQTENASIFFNCMILASPPPLSHFRLKTGLGVRVYLLMTSHLDPRFTSSQVLSFSTSFSAYFYTRSTLTSHSLPTTVNWILLVHTP
jgi:hypothetical protein